MTATRPKPAILGARRELIDLNAHVACHCFCGVRHNVGVCSGYVVDEGVRIYFNSMHGDGSGVLICLACAADYPEQMVRDAFA